MNLNHVGEIFSILCALFWAVAVVLFKKTGETVHPVSLNIFKNVLALVLCFPTLLAAGEPFLPAVDPWNYFVLALSGFLGITVADTLFFMCLNRLGANLTALVDCLYTPFVMFILFACFSEPIGLAAILGAALIISGILIGTIRAADFKVSRGDLASGIFFGAASMLLVAVGVVILKEPLGTHKSVFNSVPLLWATSFRIFAATVPLVLLVSPLKERGKYFACFRPSGVWKTMIPGSLLGTYFSMFIWLVGWKYTVHPAVAAILNQLALIFVLLLSAMFFNEKITSRKVLAVFLALAGGVIVLF
jgi:drug/metabolite transporter (DMT)-like permease